MIRALLFSLLVVSSMAQAQSACRDLFRHTSFTQITGSQDWSARRKAVVDFLKQHREVPSFIKETEQGPVPVMLMNETTYPFLKPLLDQSVGYGYNTAIEWSNNGMHGFGGEHALMRVQDTLIDNGHPGTRRGPSFTETAQTGISWRELGQIMPWRPSMIQNSYLMPKADLEAVRLYHLVRRAGLFRGRYAFTPDHDFNRSLPNTLDDILENCFRFSKSDQAPQMVEGLHRKLRETLGPDYERIMNLPETQEFTGRARKHLLNIDPYNGTKMNFFVTKAILKQTGLDRKLPRALSDFQRLTVANLLLSERAVSDYLSVLRHYQITAAHGHDDVNNGVVSFTLVYSTKPIEDQFRAATYESRGNFFHWFKENQHPIP